MADFSGLTFTVVPVVTNTGTVSAPVWTLSTALTAGTVVAGILDPVSTQHIFNPRTEGNAVAVGDTAATWLPSVKSFTATTKTDNLQSGAPSEFGQVQLFLTPAAKNVVEAASVMNYYLSPQALVITATGTF